MTTRKPYQKAPGPVSFGKPTIGPRVYLTRGPSGWPETYMRDKADAALVEFLTPLDATTVVETFWIAMTLEGREENWEDVVGYLAKITQQTSKAIPEVVGVAFWGLALLHLMTGETN